MAKASVRAVTAIKLRVFGDLIIFPLTELYEVITQALFHRGVLIFIVFLLKEVSKWFIC